jgi:hypothetical protein
MYSFQKARSAISKVVIEFFVGRLLEAEDLTPLRIHPGHDVLDDAALAGGVQRLQNHQHRIDIVGVEEFLRLSQSLEVLGQNGFGHLNRILRAPGKVGILRLVF